MSSIEEVKAMLLSAADQVDEAARFIGAATAKMIDAEMAASAAFEGTGRQDFLELSARLQKVHLDGDDVMISALGAATALRDAVATL